MIAALAKNVLPERVVGTLKAVRTRYRSAEKAWTERVFSAATPFPAHLDSAALEALKSEYPFRVSPEYDPETLQKRGATRAEYILNLPTASKAKDFLELGCWDGMVSCALRHHSMNATAIDSRDAGFDPRAAQAGVNFQTMDAMNLQFPDESFDFAFSYDAFEHFGSPENVLREAMRVVRKGGHIYLNLGHYFTHRSASIFIGRSRCPTANAFSPRTYSVSMRRMPE